MGYATVRVRVRGRVRVRVRVRGRDRVRARARARAEGRGRGRVRVRQGAVSRAPCRSSKTHTVRLDAGRRSRSGSSASRENAPAIPATARWWQAC